MALLESFQDWFHSVDGSFGVDIIYLDYTKASDSVPHRRLLHKLKGYGVSGNLLLYYYNYGSQIFSTKDIKEWLLTELILDGAVL